MSAPTVKEFQFSLIGCGTPLNSSRRRVDWHEFAPLILSSRASARRKTFGRHICASRPTSQSPAIRFGLGELDRVGDRLFMGRRPKPKSKTQNQLAKLNEENRRLREIVAYLSQVVLTRIVEPTETSAEQSGSAETPLHR